MSLLLETTHHTLHLVTLHNSNPSAQGSEGDLSSDFAHSKRQRLLLSCLEPALKHHQLQPRISISLFVLLKELSLSSETWQIWSNVRWIYVTKSISNTTKHKDADIKKQKTEAPFYSWALYSLFIYYWPVWNTTGDEYKMSLWCDLVCLYLSSRSKELKSGSPTSQGKVIRGSWTHAFSVLRKMKIFAWWC